MQAFNLEPAWTYWVNLAEVQLWQAVALSLNIEPRSLSPTEAPPSRVPGLLNRGPSDYIDRLRVAEGHLVSLETVPAPKGRDRALVRLLALRRWGELLPAPWTFPEGFPSAVAEHIKPQVSERVGLGVVEVAASGVVTNSTKGMKRRDDLWPAIEAAQAKCSNRLDTAAVWTALRDMAKEEKPPLLGNERERIRWQRGGRVGYLSRGALHKRLHPETRCSKRR